MLGFSEIILDKQIWKCFLLFNSYFFGVCLTSFSRVSLCTIWAYFSHALSCLSLFLTFFFPLCSGRVLKACFCTSDLTFLLWQSYALFLIKIFIFYDVFLSCYCLLSLCSSFFCFCPCLSPCFISFSGLIFSLFIWFLFQGILLIL